MKKVSIFLTLISFTLLISAQNYELSFVGNGASSTVDSVQIVNLSNGNSKSLKGSQVLHLIPAVNTLLKNNVSKATNSLNFFPNPFVESSFFYYESSDESFVTLNVTDISGKRIFNVQQKLGIGIYKFEIKGLNSGLFLVNLKSIDNQYFGYLISRNTINKMPSLTLVEEKIMSNSLKKIQYSQPQYVDMEYTDGEILKFTFFSGVFRTISTYIPTQNETINCMFVECRDFDGNNYSVVNLYGQTWMAENLKTTKYCNGDVVLNEQNMTNWSKLGQGSYVSYFNMPTYDIIYGKLYNWFAVADTRNICPCGWHVPSDNEWTILTNNLGGEDFAGAKLKQTGIEFWQSSNTASNSSGFTALPAGARSNLGYFGEQGSTAYFMTSTAQSDPKYIWLRGIGNGEAIFRNESVKTFGGSIRCVKN